MFKEGIKYKFIRYFTVLLITLCTMQFIFILFHFKGFMKNGSILIKVESSFGRSKKSFISESLTGAHPNCFYSICDLKSFANDFNLCTLFLCLLTHKIFNPGSWWAGACIVRSKLEIPLSLFMSPLSFEIKLF